MVDGQTVYAAAGITHYDGTYVVALDAMTDTIYVIDIANPTENPATPLAGPAALPSM